MSHPLYELLRELEAASIHFTLGRHRNVSRFPGSEAVVGDETLVRQLIAGNYD